MGLATLPVERDRLAMFVLRRCIRVSAALVGILFFACDGTPPTAALGTCESNPRQAVLQLVNDIRIDHGVEPLQLDLRLAVSAQTHSEDMTANNFMSHTGSDGSNPGERMTAAGYPWNGWSENVAAGQPTPESVVNAWMNSSGHRANILRTSSEHVGIGYDHESGTTYGHYWTMNFGSSESEPATGLGCHP
ncbi:MAG: CAP domain-containing protein [Gemmatimonadetes bacterium]|nr:CAP domain-containing protein [Gemmatimonadota bacterium]